MDATSLNSAELHTAVVVLVDVLVLVEVLVLWEVELNVLVLEEVLSLVEVVGEVDDEVESEVEVVGLVEVVLLVEVEVLVEETEVEVLVLVTVVEVEVLELELVLELVLVLVLLKTSRRQRTARLESQRRGVHFPASAPFKLRRTHSVLALLLSNGSVRTTCRGPVVLLPSALKREPPTRDCTPIQTWLTSGSTGVV